MYQICKTANVFPTRLVDRSPTLGIPESDLLNSRDALLNLVAEAGKFSNEKQADDWIESTASRISEFTMSRAQIQAEAIKSSLSPVVIKDTVRSMLTSEHNVDFDQYSLQTIAALAEATNMPGPFMENDQIREHVIKQISYTYTRVDDGVYWQARRSEWISAYKKLFGEDLEAAVSTEDLARVASQYFDWLRDGNQLTKDQIHILTRDKDKFYPGGDVMNRFITQEVYKYLNQVDKDTQNFGRIELSYRNFINHLRTFSQDYLDNDPILASPENPQLLGNIEYFLSSKDFLHQQDRLVDFLHAVDESLGCPVSQEINLGIAFLHSNIESLVDNMPESYKSYKSLAEKISCNFSFTPEQASQLIAKLINKYQFSNYTTPRALSEDIKKMYQLLGQAPDRERDVMLLTRKAYDSAWGSETKLEEMRDEFSLNYDPDRLQAIQKNWTNRFLERPTDNGMSLIAAAKYAAFRPTGEQGVSQKAVESRCWSLLRSKNGIHQIELLREATGITPTFDDQNRLNQAYAGALFDKDFSLYKSIQSLTGIQPDFSDRQVNSAVKGYIKYCISSRGHGFKETVTELSEQLGVPLNYNEDELKEILRSSLGVPQESSPVVKEFLTRITGKTELPFEMVNGSVQSLYHRIINRAGNMDIMVSNLQEFTGIKPEWNQKEVLDSMAAFISTPFVCVKIAETTGIKLSMADESFIHHVKDQYIKFLIRKNTSAAEALIVAFGKEITVSPADAVQILKDNYISAKTDLTGMLDLVEQAKEGGVFSLDAQRIDQLVQEWANVVSTSDTTSRVGELRLACEKFGFSYSKLSSPAQQKFAAWFLDPQVANEARYFATSPKTEIQEPFKRELEQVLKKTLISNSPEHMCTLLDNVKDNYPSLAEQVRSRIYIQCRDNLSRIIVLSGLDDWVPLLETMAPSPQERQSFYAQIMENRVPNPNEMEQFIKYSLLAGKQVDLEQYTTPLINSFMLNPLSATSFFSVLDGLSEKNPAIKFSYSQLKKHPWIDSFNKLVLLQRRTTNTEHDPWVKELPGLLSTIKSNHQLDFDSSAQARAFNRYFENFGMLNLPTIFGMYFELGTTDIKNIDPNMQKTLAEIGIATTFSGGKPREMQDIFVDFEAFCHQFRISLTHDRLPPGIQTAVGREYYEYLRGASSHSSSTYSTEQVLRQVENMYTSQPEKYKVPEYLQPATFTVESKKRNNSSAITKEKAVATKKILESSQSTEVFRAPYAAMSEAFSTPRTLSEMRDQVVNTLEAKQTKMLQTLGWSVENLDVLLANSESSDRKTAGLVENLKGVRTAMTDIRQTANIAVEPGTEAETGYVEQVAFLTALAKNISQVKIESLRTASLQFFASLQSPEMKTQMLGIKNLIDIADPTGAYYYADALKNNVLEHFLFNTGTPEEIRAHSGHQPFDPETHHAIAKALGVNVMQQDKRSTIPIDALLDRLKQLDEETEEASKIKENISMIPVGGIGLVMAPYSGDMCASKLDMDIARTTKYPGLNAYMYVTNEGKSNEKIVGSMFVMSTKSEDGAPTLLFRANNPRQNYIKDMNAEQFVKASVGHIVDDARRLWATQEPRTKVRVVTPIDGASQSATNRPDIFAATLSLLGQPKPIPLEYSETTYFNQYASYDSTLTQPGYNRASRLVFEIDNDGTETWHAKQDYMGINKQSEHFPAPALSIKQLDSNSGREIEGIASAELNFRRLRSDRDYSVLSQNSRITGSENFSKYVYFIDTVGEEDIQTLQVEAPHWRSVTSKEPEVKFEYNFTTPDGNVISEPYFVANTKGCGYTKPTAKGQNFANYSSWTLDPKNSESKVYGCISEWEGEDTSFYVEKSNELTAAGLRCEMNWATTKVEALPFRGKMRSVAWLKQHGVLPNDPDYFPVINVRLLKTNTRIEEALEASGRRKEIFNEAFETFNKEQAYKGQSVFPVESQITKDAYFKFFFESMAKNMAVLLNGDYIYAGDSSSLHSSNVSMAAEVMDIDTVHINSENAQDNPEQLVQTFGVALGHLKDMGNVATGLRDLLNAADAAKIKYQGAEDLVDMFMAKLDQELSEEKLNVFDHKKEDVTKWMEWLLRKVVINGDGLPSLKRVDISEWGRTR